VSAAATRGAKRIRDGRAASAKKKRSRFRLHFSQPRIYDLVWISASQIALPTVRPACQSARIGVSVVRAEPLKALEPLDPRIEVTTSLTALSMRL
jgi:hypothetical protein